MAMNDNRHRTERLRRNRRLAIVDAARQPQELDKGTLWAGAMLAAALLLLTSYLLIVGAPQ
jgi:hypothetical protein